MVLSPWCVQGSKRMVKYLLRRGAFLNAQNSTGNTALHYCYTYGHTELADYLKAKVNTCIHLLTA